MEQIRHELDKYIEGRSALSKELAELSSTSKYDYKELFNFATSIVDYCIEDALIIMIRIIEINPMYFDEAIRDSIFLWIQNEGNRNTYNYLLSRYVFLTNEDTLSYFKDMVNSLVWKYEQIGVQLKKID